MRTIYSISSNRGFARLLNDACGSLRQMAPISFDASRAVLDGAVDDRRLSARELGLACGVAQVGLGCVPFVPVMKPADLRDRHDAAIGWRGDRARDRRVLVQRQVSA